MPNLNPNSTNYEHSFEPNTNDLTMAMDYTEDGKPAVRVLSNIQGDIIIEGAVTIPGEVTVVTSHDNPLHTATHLLDENDAEYTDSNPFTVDGTVNIGTMPNVTVNQPIAVTDNNGSLTVDGTVELGATSLSALENINATVSGTVSVDNFPATQTVDGTVTIQDGGGSITVDGTVNANVTFPSIYPVSKDTNPNSNTNPIYVEGVNNASFFAPTQSDAFGRLRVSNPFTLFDGAMRYRDNLFKWDQVDTGTASSTFLPNESSVLMSTTGAGTTIRQSKQVFSYQPGKSLLIMTTFVMNAPTAGVTQRVGYYGAQNGVYFEVDGTTVNLVIRKYTSGSVDSTTEKIAQASWNGNKLLSLDVTKAQIFWTDIEWLGVGSVRCGFVINGEFVVCHTFHHANVLDRVYMTTACLPVRYELISTGPAASMRAICSTVISEGGYSNRSQSRAIGTDLTGKNLSQAAYRPLVCLRLKSANLDSIVIPTAFDVYGLQQAAFVYRIILNPTLTNASWTSAGDDSSVEYDLSATALSGGTVVAQGIFIGSNKGGSAAVSSNDVDFSQQLGRTIAGVSDIWCLAAIATTNNDDAVGVVNWQEHV